VIEYADVEPNARAYPLRIAIQLAQEGGSGREYGDSRIGAGALR
jgi:hypothetical protein